MRERKVSVSAAEADNRSAISNSLSPCNRNCSARFWKRGADGVMGIAVTMAKIVARTMKRERILLIFMCDVQDEDAVDRTSKIW